MEWIGCCGAKPLVVSSSGCVFGHGRKWKWSPCGRHEEDARCRGDRLAGASRLILGRRPRDPGPPKMGAVEASFSRTVHPSRGLHQPPVHPVEHCWRIDRAGVVNPLHLVLLVLLLLLLRGAPIDMTTPFLLGGVRTGPPLLFRRSRPTRTPPTHPPTHRMGPRTR